MAPMTGTQPEYNTSLVYLFLCEITHHSGVSDKNNNKRRGPNHKVPFAEKKKKLRCS